MAAVDTHTFQTLHPSRFISFSFPNPDLSLLANPYAHLLRIAVLDSPLPALSTPQIAALLVPKNRQNDWIFSTHYGHFQLLFNSPGISRLILVGDDTQTATTSGIYSPPIRADTASFREKLTPILLALSPKSAFRHGVPDVQFVSYEDDVIRSVSVELRNGSVIGDMLVEDVEIEMRTSPIREFRRRLRFKRMPNLVQTEIRIVPAEGVPETESFGLGVSEFRPDTDLLVQPYLVAMAASLFFMGPVLSRARVLCVGVGGGALPMFLRTRFEFDVLGVEMDETVVLIARKYFGLTEGEFLRVCVGDGIEFMKVLARRAVLQNLVSRKFVRLWEEEEVEAEEEISDVENGVSFITVKNNDVSSDHWGTMDLDGGDTLIDVIMIDLDSDDAQTGLSAPPLHFVQRSVILAARLALREHGILVVNVIPPSESFYCGLQSAFREFFSELYEIDVGNGENYVLIAAASSISCATSESENSIVCKLKEAVQGRYLDGIRKL